MKLEWIRPLSKASYITFFKYSIGMKQEALETTIKRIDAKLTSLSKESKKPVEKEYTWVKASTIMELTAWDKEKLRRMKNNGLVKQRRDETGIWYALESINPIFLKSK